MRTGLRAFVACASIGAALVFVAPRTTIGQVPTLSHPGRWTPSTVWDADDPAIHLLLFPGTDATHQARIYWWAHDPPFHGGGWKWRVGSDNCTSWPVSSFFEPITVPSPNYDAFCSGHAHLADGRLLVTGGNETGENGIVNSAIFDPTGPSWTPQPQLAEPRWYSTSTTLSDGRVFTMAGRKYSHMLFLGGRSVAASLPSDRALHRYGLTLSGRWENPVLQTSDPDWPPALEGAAAADGGNLGYWWIVGGRLASGDYTSEGWANNRSGNPLASDYSYDWVTLEDAGTAPAGRRDHSLLLVGRGKNGRDTLLVFGGRNDGTVFEQMYVVVRQPATGHWLWSEIHPVSSVGFPGPRYGHVALYDVKRVANDALEPPLRRRVLFFGGASAVGGLPTDAAVWALDLTRSPPEWTRPSLRTSATPGPRVLASLGNSVNFGGSTDSTLVLSRPPVKRASGVDEHLALLFGGKDGSGQRPQTVWQLWTDTTVAGLLEWRQMNVSPSPPAPTGRTGHSAVMAFGRLVVGGGDTGGSADESVY